MVVEEALAKLPYDEVTVDTPTGESAIQMDKVTHDIAHTSLLHSLLGHKYKGKKFKRGMTCGVSIMRSGK